MLISTATLDALRTTVDQSFWGAYAGTPVWYDKLTTEVTSSNKSNTYAWAAQQLRMREWIGPRVVQNLSEHSYVLLNKPWEMTVELDRDDIEDDNFGIFTAVTVPGMAEAARKHPDVLAAALLNSNPVGFDGVTLFNDAHPTFDGAGTTYDNNFTVDLDGDGVAQVYAAMTSITGENGLPLGINPTLLIVPPQLTRSANVVANSTTYAVPGTTGASATVDNPLRGMFSVLTVPELAGQPNNWYMADVSKSIKPFIFQKRRPLEMVVRQDPADPKVFEENKYQYGASARYNMGITLPFLIAKAVHTP